MTGLHPRFMRSCTVRTLLSVLFSLHVLQASGQTGRDRPGTESPWYENRFLRIYHPNMKNWEVRDFDAAGFVEDCAAVHAEAIVVNAGGIYAFYPSKIEYHTPNPFIGGRDLFGEICKEAKKRDLKVIARLDFAGASSELAILHPDWFHVNKDGTYKSHRGSTTRYSTTPTGGYQNEAFAHEVLKELVENYEIFGVHLNAAGFSGISYDKVSMEKFGPLLRGGISENQETARALSSWRQEVVEEMILNYKKILHGENENILLMGEIAGAESPGWAHAKGYDNRRLSHAFTHLLLTSGQMSEDLYRFRHWVSLSADLAWAALPDNSPIINLKAPSAGLDYSDFLKPVEEYRFYCYQAIAHNAGLKIPTYGTLGNQQDPRAKELVASVFSFMKNREAYAVHPGKVNQVALVYPGMGIEDVMISGAEANTGLRDEFLGLYRAMAGRHVQFEVLYDHIITEYALEQYEVMVVPTLVYFNDLQIEKIHRFIENGGRLVMLDHSYAGPGFLEIPDLFQRLTGIRWTALNGKGNYAVPSTDFVSPRNFIRAPLGLSTGTSCPNYRLSDPPDDSKVWLYACRENVYRGTPEEIGKIEKGDNAVLWSKPIGEGDLVYFGNGLGDMMYLYDHPDYTELLFQMLFHEGVNPPLLTTNAPPTVEITFHEVKDGNLIQFVNGTGKTPLDQVIPLPEISVTLSKQLPVKGMVYQPGQEGYAITGISEQGETSYTIKQLNGFAEIFIPFEH